MSEARDIESIVADLAGTYTDDTWLAVRIDALIADWRAKKAEIERRGATLILPSRLSELETRLGKRPWPANFAGMNRDIALELLEAARAGINAADAAYAKCEEIAEYEAAQGWSSARRIADTITALRQRHAEGAENTA
jgi:hypothetical protein